jgi:hypothetical protein
MSGLESHMIHILSGRNLSPFDNESGSRMYNEISRGVNDRITCQSNSITPDNLFKLRRKKAKSSKSVPAELLTELALLWRTIGILRYSVGVPGVLTSFYADLLTKIVDVEPLSLSNFSNDNIDQDYVTQQRGHDGATSIGLANADSLGYINTTAIKPSKEVIFAVPELEYLQENSGFEGDEVNDPLGVVQKLFNSSESFASSVPIAEKGAMHSVCLALAVKSGRLSLLLQSALLLSLKNTENDSDSESSSSNLQILRDIVEYITAGYRIKEELAANSSNISPKSHSSSSLNRSNIGADIPENFPGRFLGNSHESMRSQECSGDTSRISLSFGKADHGKLGLGASQVTLSLSSLFLYLLLNLLLNSLET